MKAIRTPKQVVNFEMTMQQAHDIANRLGKLQGKLPFASPLQMNSCHKFIEAAFMPLQPLTPFGEEEMTFLVCDHNGNRVKRVVAVDKQDAIEKASAEHGFKKFQFRLVSISQMDQAISVADRD